MNVEVLKRRSLMYAATGHRGKPASNSKKQQNKLTKLEQ